MMKETPRTQPSAIAVEQERSDEEREMREEEEGGGGGGRRESWINERDTGVEDRRKWVFWGEMVREDNGRYG